MEAVVKGLPTRKKWIDIYRGIAIMLVVLGHLDVPRPMYNFIFVFHMYAFFFISGVTYKTNSSSYKETVIKNIKRLLVPYIIYAYMWDATSFAIRLYLHTQREITLQSVLRNVFSVIIGGGVIDSTADIGTAWFLYSMFFVRVSYEGLS